MTTQDLVGMYPEAAKCIVGEHLGSDFDKRYAHGILLETCVECDACLCSSDCAHAKK
jgi:hypothetical protein